MLLLLLRTAAPALAMHPAHVLPGLTLELCILHPRRGERLPMDVGRACLAELAGAPERADWRTCKAAGPEQEAAATDAFKASFGSYDPMQQQ